MTPDKMQKYTPKKLTGTDAVIGAYRPIDVMGVETALFLIGPAYQQKLFGQVVEDAIAIVIFLSDSDICDVEAGEIPKLPDSMTHDDYIKMYPKLKSTEIPLRPAAILVSKRGNIEFVSTNGCDIDRLRV